MIFLVAVQLNFFNGLKLMKVLISIVAGLHLRASTRPSIAANH